MTTNYKSTRLLVEAINKEMDAVRKALMGNVVLPWGPLNELRDLVGQLAEKASRPTLDDVQGMPPGDYVAAMKPLVAKYHLQLMVANQLAPCLCMDLQLAGCVVIMVGDDKTSVRVAHDPSRPEVALVVDAILASIDVGTKQAVEDGAAMLEAGGLIGVRDEDVLEPKLCGGCDCVAGACDCVGCEGRLGGNPDEARPEMGDEDGWG